MNESSGARSFAVRWASLALRHLEKVDVRTGTALERAGLFQTDSEGEGDETVVGIVTGAMPGRVSTVPGPTIFYKDPDKDEQQLAIDMPDLLFSPDVRLREAAWAHLVALSQGSQPCITEHTASDLYGQREALLDQDAVRWRSAALELHAALEIDIRCQVAGVRQALTEGFEEGLRNFLPRVLRPPLSAFEHLGLRYLAPSRQDAAMGEDLATMVEHAGSLRDACDKYLTHFGVLPLAGAASFSAMARLWANKQGSEEGLWTEIWSWGTGSALAQFYACCFFLSRPRLVPEGHRQAFVAAVNDSVRASAGEPILSKTHWFWRISHELARHYLRHLELSAPGAPGETLSLWSWWLGLYVSAALCERLDGAKHLRDVAILPQAMRSELAWRLASPALAVSPSSLATHWASSPWVLSLAASIEEADLDHLRATIDGCDTSDLRASITSTFLLWPPTERRANSTRTYLFELDTHRAATRWAEILPESESTALLVELSRLYSKLADAGAFVEAFDRLPVSSEADQFIVASAARVLATREELPLARVWAKLGDPDWGNRALRELSPPALEMLFGALSFSLRRSKEVWPGELAHLFCRACLEFNDDEERRETMFMYMLVASAQAYSASAIERLLSGDTRAEFLDVARHWKARLRSALAGGPPWVAARVRSILGALPG